MLPEGIKIALKSKGRYMYVQSGMPWQALVPGKRSLFQRQGVMSTNVTSKTEGMRSISGEFLPNVKSRSGDGIDLSLFTDTLSLFCFICL